MQTCEPSDPDNPSDNLCTATFCTTSDGQRGFWVRIFRRRDDSENWQPWPAAGGGQLRECVTAAEPVSLDEVRDALLAILEEKYTTLAAPRISLQPPATAIVNMPVIASTADAGQHGFDIDNPLPGRVAITPSYAWTWSNGDTSTGPGRAYDPAVNPLTTPQHYTVRATYSDSGPGRVELQATWDVALTVPGAGTVTDIEPLVFTTDADFRVAGARTVLVD